MQNRYSFRSIYTIANATGGAIQEPLTKNMLCLVKVILIGIDFNAPYFLYFKFCIYSILSKRILIGLFIFVNSL